MKLIEDDEQLSVFPLQICLIVKKSFKIDTIAKLHPRYKQG